jgi:hypothetical protein
VRAVVVVGVLEGFEAFDLGAQRAGGLAVSCFGVRCSRSWRPFSWGLPRAIRSGTTPTLISRTASCDRPPTARLAKGGPLSLRIALGGPYSAKARARCGQTCSGSVRPTARQTSGWRLAVSLTVSGSTRVPSPVRDQPSKSMHQTSFGPTQAANS